MQGSNPSLMKSCLKQLGLFSLLMLKISCLACKLLQSNFLPSVFIFFSKYLWCLFHLLLPSIVLDLNLLCDYEPSSYPKHFRNYSVWSILNVDSIVRLGGFISQHCRNFSVFDHFLMLLTLSSNIVLLSQVSVWHSDKGKCSEEKGSCAYILQQDW